ncbi:TetR/AcrR family transcriptional regulator [Rhizobium sp. CG5]|uniref:TetR/AcrR family transcriptional regulator n=1 Tax=Rhizobium sp. CG5 TaxID=2726076 RepID=UPI00203343F4|nr:TetR/AcrR family transcriptional regulator [Rhizobium sp. CG5]MCM2472897.1 TetR/AcrR family transcriptional regulator [Rhizobium sp. CG5]
MARGERAPISPGLRRKPKQERAKERIDAILKTTMRLLGEKGVDAVTMKEIAAGAGGPISSVYQYFPNKSAILIALFEHHAQSVRSLLAESFSRLQSLDEAIVAIEQTIRAYYGMFSANPALRQLQVAIQADKSLTNLDINERRVEADFFFQATVRFIPEANRDEFRRTVFLMFQLVNNAIRLALVVPPEESGDVMDDFIAMMCDQMWLLGRGDTSINV